MKIKTLIVLIISSVLLYFIGLYLSNFLRQGTMGITLDIAESQKRGVFVSEYKLLKSSIWDSILDKRICKKIWLEKRWFYGILGQTEIETNGYNLILVLDKPLDDGDFNKKWLIQSDTLGGYAGCYPSRHEDNFIILCSIKNDANLDSFTYFFSSIINKTKSLGQFKLVKTNN